MHIYNLLLYVFSVKFLNVFHTFLMIYTPHWAFTG